MPAKTAATLALLDSNTLFRNGFSSMMKRHCTAYPVLFEISNCLELPLKIETGKPPDIILVGFGTSDAGSLTCIHWIRKFYPRLKILAMGFIENEEILIRLRKAGIDGYVDKSVEPEELKRAVETIMTKGFYFRKQLRFFSQRPDKSD